MIDVAAMGHLDRCRRPAIARPHRASDRMANVFAKEWHHIVVHHDDLVLLVNLSESETAHGPVARVIVMAHGAQWWTDVTTAEASDVVIATDRLDARYGPNTRFRFVDGAYQLCVTHPGGRYDIELRLVPQTPGSMLTGVTLSTVEKLSWFFAPRLLATGHVTIEGTSHALTDALAYHDHNWGRFDWGGDYAWEWISVVNHDWSVTASRLMNGARSRITSQYLHIESNLGQCTFRDNEIEVESLGRRRAHDVPVVPGVMRLLTPALVEDVPDTMRWRARRGDQHVNLVINPGAIARLAMPSERAVDRVVVLAEAVGDATLGAQLGDHRLSGSGRSILELLR